MRLEDLKINIPAVDNEPFIRSLTAVLQTSTFDEDLSATTYTIVTGNEPFAWYFPDQAFATKVDGTLYPKGAVLPASAINTIVVYFSAEKYNFITDTYSLNVLPISAVSDYDTAYNQYIYDTFPDIDTTFLINYQPTDQEYISFDQLSSVNVATTAAVPFVKNLTAVSRFPTAFTFSNLDNELTNFTYLHFIGPKNNITYFYRLTSLTPYKADLKLTSSNYTFSANCYDARYYFNKSRTITLSSVTKNVFASATFVQNLTNIPNYLLNSWQITAFEPNLNAVDIVFKLDNGYTFNSLLTTVYFNSTQTSRASSVFVTLYAETPPNSKTQWYTPHRIERALSAVFIPYWLSAGDFIAWPEKAFVDAIAPRINITPANVLLSSPGLDFYGEGHTEYIYLSTQSKSNNTKINWYLDNTLMLSGINSLSSTNSYVTAVVPITTEIGFYPTIPITLQVTDTLFTSAAPRYYYDDNTGNLTVYPYIVTTVDEQGQELTTNTKFKESIVVKPYDAAPFYFNPGINDQIYLPFNQTPFEYTATFQSTISVGLSVSDPCYDKYGFIWKWSSLTSDNRNSNLATTWATLQSAISAGTLSATDVPGKYSKRWKKEGGLSAQAFNLNPIFCSAGPIIWTLSTTNWSNTFIDPLTSGLSAIENQEGLSVFDYSLRLFNNGELLYTTSYYDNETVSLNVERTIISRIFQDPYDWQPKPQPVKYTKEIESIAPPDIKLYTPNYYVLTGTQIKLENASSRLNLVSALEFTFVDSDASLSSVMLYPPNLDQDLSVTYTNTGYKTVKAKAFINYSPYNIGILSYEFTNIVRIIESYDNVDSDLYRSLNQPLTLPYPTKPQIQPNEFVLADVFNTNIKKIHLNLEYLENRGYGYLDTASHYHGWLGNPFPYYSPNSPYIQLPSLTSIVVEEIIAQRGFGIDTDTIQVPVTTVQDVISPKIITVTNDPKNIRFKPTYTWRDLDCIENPSLNISWENSCSQEITINEVTQVSSVTTKPQTNFSFYSTWETQTLSAIKVDPTCFGLYEQEWRWKSRKKGRAQVPITWAQTKLGNEYPKRWFYEGSSSINPVACDEGYWNLSVPGLNRFYDPIPLCDISPGCIYTGVASKNNILLLGHGSAFRILSSDYTARYFEGRRTFDDYTEFGDIKNICIDSKNRIIVLDNLQSKVFVYRGEDNFDNLKLFNSWGGYGSSISRNKFNDARDVHVDQYDNIWISDTGNFCVKQYSNTGSWINTIIDDRLRNSAPLSVCVDSQNNVHILTEKNILVYSYEGVFIFGYDYLEYTKSVGIKINSSYNREIIYLCTNTQVLKFYRTGVVGGYILRNKQCVDNITGIYHDEFRNLLITTNSRVLKYTDPMVISSNKGPLPPYYWKLEDILIHPEEYIQNWVYNKALQRLWDNIEYFRSTIYFKNNSSNLCKHYKPPIYTKADITIHQNEIVTSVVLNRVFNYLWENFKTLIDYFDPSCKDTINRINI
jgi:hypothetical protein